MESLAYPAQPREISHINSSNGKKYASVFFVLRQYFRSWRALFYKERQKVFPEDLVLSPISLAVWYMDDGCWTGAKCVIATESFDAESGDAIQQALLNQFGIETVIGKNRNWLLERHRTTHFTGVFLRILFPA